MFSYNDAPKRVYLLSNRYTNEFNLLHNRFGELRIKTLKTIVGQNGKWSTIFNNKMRSRMKISNSMQNPIVLET